MKSFIPTLSQGEDIKIDISSLPTGIYYCTLNAGTQKITRSFVVIR